MRVHPPADDQAVPGPDAEGRGEGDQRAGLVPAEDLRLQPAVGRGRLPRDPGQDQVRGPPARVRERAGARPAARRPPRPHRHHIRLLRRLRQR